MHPESAKGQTGFILLAIFILGMAVELYFVFSFFTSELTLAEVLEKTFITGFLIAILLVVAIMLLRQNKLARKLKQPIIGGSRRSSKEVRRELSQLYSDLGALKILYKDKLMNEKHYKEKKKLVDSEVKIKLLELKDIERIEKDCSERTRNV